MYLQQLVKKDQGGVGYLVGDSDTAVCAVVDPPLDMIDDILELVAAKGMRITAVIETNLHADVVSGSRELARCTERHREVSLTQEHRSCQQKPTRP